MSIPFPAPWSFCSRDIPILVYLKRGVLSRVVQFILPFQIFSKQSIFQDYDTFFSSTMLPFSSSVLDAPARQLLSHPCAVYIDLLVPLSPPIRICCSEFVPSVQPFVLFSGRFFLLSGIPITCYPPNLRESRRLLFPGRTFRPALARTELPPTSAAKLLAVCTRV